MSSGSPCELELPSPPELGLWSDLECECESEACRVGTEIARPTSVPTLPSADGRGRRFEDDDDGESVFGGSDDDDDLAGGFEDGGDFDDDFDDADDGMDAEVDDDMGEP